LLDDLFAPAERIDQPQDSPADGVVGREHDLDGTMPSRIRQQEADLLRRSEQAHAVTRTAELARQVACG
jgi:hypothetical protein